MTDAELQELSARLERLKRSNGRWKALTTVLGVLFLLLLSLMVVAAVGMDQQMARTLQAADEAALRQRVAEEQRRAVEAEARRREAQGAKGQAEEARPQRPAGDDHQGP